MLARGLLSAALSGLAIAGLASASYMARGSMHRLIHPPRDLMLGSVAAPANAPLAPWLTQADIMSASRDRLLFTGTRHIPVSATELGFSIDTERTLEKTQRAFSKQTWVQRVQRAFSPAPVWTSVEADVSLDEAAARQRLAALAPALYRAPVNATLDTHNYRRVRDVPGRALDIEGTLRRLRSQPFSEEVIELAFHNIPAEVKDEDLPQVDVGRVLSSFETDFRKKAGPGRSTFAAPLNFWTVM